MGAAEATTHLYGLLQQSWTPPALLLVVSGCHQSWVPPGGKGAPQAHTEASRHQPRSPCCSLKSRGTIYRHTCMLIRYSQPRERPPAVKTIKDAQITVLKHGTMPVVGAGSRKCCRVTLLLAKHSDHRCCALGLFWDWQGLVCEALPPQGSKRAWKVICKCITTGKDLALRGITYCLPPCTHGRGREQGGSAEKHRGCLANMNHTQQPQLLCSFSHVTGSIVYRGFLQLTSFTAACRKGTLLHVGCCRNHHTTSSMHLPPHSLLWPPLCPWAGSYKKSKG